MPNEAKVRTVAELREELAQRRAVVVTDYRGLTVKEMAEIRAALHKHDIRYRVVKNRLLKIAAEGPRRVALEPLLSGPTAVAFGHDEALTARAVLDALRPYRAAKVTGAVLGTRTLTAEEVQRLAALPPRDVLLGQLAGAMAGPLTTLGALLGANLRNLGYALVALRDRKAAT
jgi:large subunit ribosomal protein L10